MNQHEIQIIGKAPVESSLDDTKDYSIAYKRLGIRSIVKTPLEENGEYKYTYKLENLADLTIIGQDKVIQGKNKSNSKRLRNRCWIYSNDLGIDNEKFYNDFSSKLIEKFDSVVEFLELDNNN